MKDYKKLYLESEISLKEGDTFLGVLYILLGCVVLFNLIKEFSFFLLILSLLLFSFGIWKLIKSRKDAHRLKEELKGIREVENG